MTTQATKPLSEEIVCNLKASAYQGHFGGCPVCGHAEGPVNVLKENWFICREHRIKWCTGVGIFDVYDVEWEAWEAIDKFLSYFKEIPAGETLALDEEAESDER